MSSQRLAEMMTRVAAAHQRLSVQFERANELMKAAVTKLNASFGGVK